MKWSALAGEGHPGVLVEPAGGQRVDLEGLARSHTAPARKVRPMAYRLGSYRIATAPEPNSSRLTSFKSTCVDSPANNVGPWPASLGCTNELVLIDQSQLPRLPACAQRTVGT
jgi:hypothetical protein